MLYKIYTASDKGWEYLKFTYNIDEAFDIINKLNRLEYKKVIIIEHDIENNQDSIIHLEYFESVVKRKKVK